MKLSRYSYVGYLFIVIALLIWSAVGYDFYVLGLIIFGGLLLTQDIYDYYLKKFGRKKVNKIYTIILILIVLGIILILFFSYYEFPKKDKTPWNPKDIKLSNPRLSNEEYEKCINETELEKERLQSGYGYMEGVVLTSFDSKNGTFTREYINKSIQNLGLEIKSWTYFSSGLILVPKGEEVEWVCKLKEEEFIKETYFNAILQVA